MEYHITWLQKKNGCWEGKTLTRNTLDGATELHLSLSRFDPDVRAVKVYELIDGRLAEIKRLRDEAHALENSRLHACS